MYENLSSQQFFRRHCSFFFFLMSDVPKFIRLSISFPPPLLLTWIRFSSSSSSSLESYAHTTQRYAAVQNRCLFNSFPGNVMFSRAPSSTNLNSARRNEKRKRERKKRNCVCACELPNCEFSLHGYRYQIARESWIQRYLTHFPPKKIFHDFFPCVLKSPNGVKKVFLHNSLFWQNGVCSRNALEEEEDEEDW